MPLSIAKFLQDNWAVIKDHYWVFIVSSVLASMVCSALYARKLKKNTQEIKRLKKENAELTSKTNELKSKLEQYAAVHELHLWKQPDKALDKQLLDSVTSTK